MSAWLYSHITFELMWNTVLISGGILLLRGVLSGLITAIQLLVEHLIKTTAKVELLEGKLSVVIEAIGDVQKLRGDVNKLFDRLRKAEDKLSSS